MIYRISDNHLNVERCIRLLDRMIYINREAFDIWHTILYLLIIVPIRGHVVFVGINIINTVIPNTIFL